MIFLNGSNFLPNLGQENDWTWKYYFGIIFHKHRIELKFLACRLLFSLLSTRAVENFRANFGRNWRIIIERNWLMSKTLCWSRLRQAMMAVSRISDIVWMFQKEFFKKKYPETLNQNKSDPQLWRGLHYSKYRKQL